MLCREIFAHPMSRIHNNILNLEKHLSEDVSAFNKAGKGEHLFSWIRPLGSDFCKSEIPQSEKLLVMSLDDIDLFNRICILDSIHNTLIDSLARYRSDRDALLGAMPAEMDGLVGQVELKKEDWLKIAPRIAALDDSLKQIIERIPRDVRESGDVLNDVARHVNELTGANITFDKDE